MPGLQVFVGFPKTYRDHTAQSNQDRVLYTRERLMKIAVEATRRGSIFSVEDRMGLISDELACAKAGLTKITDALELIHLFKDEKECWYLQFSTSLNHQYPDSVWVTIAIGLAEIQSIWWEYPEILKDLHHFMQVRSLQTSIMPSVFFRRCSIP